MRNSGWVPALLAAGGFACQLRSSAVGACPGPSAVNLKPPVLPTNISAARLYPTPPSCITGSTPSDAGRAAADSDSKQAAGTAYGIVDRQPGQGTPALEPGKIRCGQVQCETGKEICCEGKNVCVRVRPGGLEELDQLCDQMDSLLIECNDSAACGPDQACCEIMLGSGQNQPVVCVPPRPAERFPCDYREACVPQLPCRTTGAQCVDGWCQVSVPSRRVHCGRAACPHLDDVCCKVPSGRTLCASKDRCEQLEGDPLAIGCTKPADCPKGEFCGVMAGGSSCMHTWDGMTDALCDTPVDCPKSLREQCETSGDRLICAPGTLSISGQTWPGTRKSCGCDDGGDKK